MVRSKLVPSIHYIELKSLDPSDTKESKYKAPLYEASVLGVNTIISIGNIKNTYITQNIVYYPIYLIKNDKVLSQIGVYEMFQEDIPQLLDDAGDINLEKAPSPLLYSFVKKSLIQQAVYLPENPEEDTKKGAPVKKSTKSLGLKVKPLSISSLASLESRDDKAAAAAVAAVEENDDDEGDDALRAAIRASLEPVPLSGDVPLKRKNIPVQNLEQSIAENKAYRPAKDEPWVQTYYHNNNFKVVRNQGGGDCLFMAICQAFLSVEPDSDISVIKLRRMLAAAMTESQFADYRERYEMFSKTLKELHAENTKLSSDNKELAERAAQPGITQSEKVTLKLQADSNKERHLQIVEEMQLYKDYMRDVYFMKGIKNIEALKEMIRKGEMTSEYWGDEWAIATLEVILNVKFIILSYRDYLAKDRQPYTQANVIACGSDIDEERYREIDAALREDKKTPAAMGAREAREATDSRDKSKMRNFEVVNPDYYIIVSHTGIHYELVTYRDTAIFTFPEIPFCIKLQIANRCIESSTGNLESFSGTFQRIPQFILFYKQELGLEGLGKEDVAGAVGLGQGGGRVASANPHFDPSIVLIYHSKSTDDAPGRAQGDHVTSKNKPAFISLISAGKGKNNWRKKLSNEWSEPFMLDGHRWLSVEHYYQANKFLKRNPEFYLLFTMDANKKSKYYQEDSILSRISHDVDLAKVAGKKVPKTIIDNKKVSLRPDEVTIDPEFFNGTNTRVLEDGTMAKFSQHDDLAKILLMTNNAKLVNYVFSKPPTVSIHLMRVRSKLRTKKGGVNVFETIHDK